MTRKEVTHELSLQLVQLGLVTLELGRVRRPDRVGYTGQLNLQLGEELVRLVQVRGDLAQKTSEGLCGDGRWVVRKCAAEGGQRAVGRLGVSPSDPACGKMGSSTHLQSRSCRPKRAEQRA